MTVTPADVPPSKAPEPKAPEERAATALHHSISLDYYETAPMLIDFRILPDGTVEMIVR